MAWVRHRSGTTIHWLGSPAGGRVYCGKTSGRWVKVWSPARALAKGRICVSCYRKLSRKVREG